MLSIAYIWMKNFSLFLFNKKIRNRFKFSVFYFCIVVSLIIPYLK